MANIIIYGGGFQAAAAASKAASQAGNAQIYVIIPYPVSERLVGKTFLMFVIGMDLFRIEVHLNGGTVREVRFTTQKQWQHGSQPMLPNTAMYKFFTDMIFFRLAQQPARTE